MSNLKPSEIVKELDKYIIGQDKAKRSVAVALRNRWRRQQVPDELRDDAEPTYAFEVLRGAGIDGRHDGLVYKNMLASYTHMRAAGDNDWPRRFAAHVRGCKR